MAGFLAIIVDTATKDYPPSTKSTNIRCIKKKCTGTIEIKVNTKYLQIGLTGLCLYLRCICTWYAKNSDL